MRKKKKNCLGAEIGIDTKKHRRSNMVDRFFASFQVIGGDLRGKGKNSMGKRRGRTYGRFTGGSVTSRGS